MTTSPRRPRPIAAALLATVVLTLPACTTTPGGPSPLPAAAPADGPAALSVVTVAAAPDGPVADELTAQVPALEAAGIAVVPVDSTDLDGHRERFAAQQLVAMNGEVHVYDVDVDWAARFSAHALDLNEVLDAGALADVDAETLAALTVDGGLVAVPTRTPGRAVLASRYATDPVAAATAAVLLAGRAPR